MADPYNKFDNNNSSNSSRDNNNIYNNNANDISKTSMKSQPK